MVSFLKITGVAADYNAGWRALPQGSHFSDGM